MSGTVQANVRISQLLHTKYQFGVFVKFGNMVNLLESWKSCGKL